MRYTTQAPRSLTLCGCGGRGGGGGSVGTILKVGPFSIFFRFLPNDNATTLNGEKNDSVTVADGGSASGPVRVPRPGLSSNHTPPNPLPLRRYGGGYTAAGHSLLSVYSLLFTL